MNDPENPDDRDFIHFDEKLWILLSKHVQKQHDIILGFVEKLEKIDEEHDEYFPQELYDYIDELKDRLK